MAHLHSVYDTDPHFQIDDVTRLVKNASSTKTVLIQHDHNSERFTFEIPRMIDGHDMSTCDVVQIHYINIDSSDRTKQYSGIYEVEDLQISPNGDDVVICSWLISANATQYVGNLSFVVRFACTTDGEIDYAWNTAIHSNVYVSKGICNSEVVAEEYADILEQWRQELFGEVYYPSFKVEQTANGATITATDKDGNTTATIENGKDGNPGYSPVKGVDYFDGKSAYQYAQDGGYTGTEEQFSKKLAQDSDAVCVTITEIADGVYTTNLSASAIDSASKANKTVYCKLGNQVFNLVNTSNFLSAYTAFFVSVGSTTVTTILINVNAVTVTKYNLATEEYVNSKTATTVTDYGAKGDGSTDDTAAFQAALAENRVVYVPGGTYKLNGTLVIRENCGLELSQDTVLQFANTSGNCIEMRGSAVLRGNHAMISVPYAFTGNVISMDTSQEGENHNNIPPYLHSGSHMFKRQRFIYDINILKPDSNGICKSTDGKCNGTAIYMHCLGTASIRWMWAITMSGVRIAGGFSYGIRAYNIDKSGDYEDNAWNHDMRIEAIVENCEIGVSMENCNCAHLAVTVQPHATESGVKYAKHGIYLNDAKYIDMIGSRVWDWNANNSLWTSGGQYQHIAMIGNCKGLLLDDFLCYAHSEDIRDLIYTDTPSNFDTMSVLQEPGSKNFKAVNGQPYFTDGVAQQKLITEDVLDAHFQTDMVKKFTDVLPTATDGSGNVFQGKGYVKSGYNIGSDGKMSANSYYGCTGFIPIKPGDTVYVHGIVLGSGDGSSNFCIYNSSFEKLANMNSANAQFQAGNNYYYHYTALENGFKVVVAPNNDPVGTAYLRFSFLSNMVKDTPMISINEEIKYTYEGFLADGINVKGESVILTSSSGKKFAITVNDSGTITATALT